MLWLQMLEITDIQNILKEAQQFMTCQTEQQDLATLTERLKPGTLYRFRFKFPWKYYLVLRYGTTEKVPVGFPKETIVRTGNPIRNTINSNAISSAKAKAFFNLNTEQKTLVVLGGSLGAQTINALIATHCTYFQQQNIQLLWQCGRQYYEQYKSLEHPQRKILPYVEAMDQLYAAADLIISRAGAGTLAELCIAAKPCILIPSPNVAENHQWHNAQALEQQNAALCLEEKNAEAQFKSIFEGLWNNTEQQRLMQQQLQQLARPQAAKAVVAEIKSIAGV